MTLEQAYLIAQIFASIAVVISLVFVGLQMRGNTEQMRIATAAGYYEIYRDHLLAAQDAEFFALFRKGFNDFEGLSVTEQGRLFAYYAVMSRGYQILHYQAGKKVFDGDLWENTQNHLADLLVSKAYQQYWATRRHHFNPSFQVFVDDLITNRPTTQLFGADEKIDAPPENKSTAQAYQPLNE